MTGFVCIENPPLDKALTKGYADMHDRRTKNAKKAFADIRKDYGL